jgi:hypothetical protein
MITFFGQVAECHERLLFEVMLENAKAAGGERPQTPTVVYRYGHGAVCHERLQHGGVPSNWNLCS